MTLPRVVVLLLAQAHHNLQCTCSAAALSLDYSSYSHKSKDENSEFRVINGHREHNYNKQDSVRECVLVVCSFVPEVEFGLSIDGQCHHGSLFQQCADHCAVFHHIEMVGKSSIVREPVVNMHWFWFRVAIERRQLVPCDGHDLIAHVRGLVATLRRQVELPLPL